MADQMNGASQLKQTLEDWRGRTLHILKTEDGDMDRVTLALQEVSIQERPDTIDDYVATEALKLIGEGTVQNEAGEALPLPYESYDIALESPVHSSVSGTLHIKTGRASYTITPE